VLKGWSAFDPTRTRPKPASATLPSSLVYLEVKCGEPPRWCSVVINFGQTRSVPESKVA
jgi:hypothetical protein